MNDKFSLKGFALTSYICLCEQMEKFAFTVASNTSTQRKTKKKNAGR